MADEESRSDSYARHMAEHENPWHFAECVWCRDERRLDQREYNRERANEAE